MRGRHPELPGRAVRFSRKMREISPKKKGAVVTVPPPAEGGVERMGVIVDPDVDLDGAQVRVRFANEEEESVSVELVQTAGGQ